MAPISLWRGRWEQEADTGDVIEAKTGSCGQK